MGTHPPPQKGGRDPKTFFSPCLSWPNCWMDQEGTWHGGRPQPRRLCVRWDPVPPLPKRGGASSPIFGLILLWPNRWMHQDATWYAGRPQPRGLCVRWGPSHPPQKGDGDPQYSAHVYCGKTAAWIKMPLGTEVDLRPDDIVLDGDPAPLPQMGAESPPAIFGPCLLWPNGWHDQDDTWHGGGPWSSHIVLDC